MIVIIYNMKTIYSYITEAEISLARELVNFLKSSEKDFYASPADEEFDIPPSHAELCEKYHIKELSISKTTAYDEYKDVPTNNKTLYITDVMISDKNSGFGSKVMQEIIAAAHKCNYDVCLHPDDMFGSNLERLVQFYEKQGFVTSEIANERNVKGKGQWYIMFNYCK